jgi:Aldo/keto reductase family
VRTLHHFLVPRSGSGSLLASKPGLFLASAEAQFLTDQLERSLRRLQLEKMDVYLLHNPEYFFTEATKRHKSGSFEALREEFYDRIRRAFSYLEGEVRRGRIGFYGVSSNTFVVPGRNPEATSLERVWMIAREVAIEHHFAVAQLPANLFESGAMLTRNCVTGNQTALEFAQEHDLAVLVNRPLNAFYRNQLIRLADTPVRSPEVDAHVDPFLPPAFRAESLSRKALAILTNTKGDRTTWTTRSARCAARRSMSTFTCTRHLPTCNGAGSSAQVRHLRIDQAVANPSQILAELFQLGNGSAMHGNLGYLIPSRPAQALNVAAELTVHRRHRQRSMRGDL